MKESVKQTFEQLFEQYPALETCRADIRAAFELLAGSFRDGGKLMLCGNGGSAADCEPYLRRAAQGISAQTRHSRRRCGYARPIIRRYGQKARYHAAARAVGHTAVQHDFPVHRRCQRHRRGGWSTRQQVYAAGRPGDVLLGISTSGKRRQCMQRGASGESIRHARGRPDRSGRRRAPYAVRRVDTRAGARSVPDPRVSPARLSLSVRHAGTGILRRARHEPQEQRQEKRHCAKIRGEALQP